MDRITVEEVAKLARLRLTSEEVESLASELTKIGDYIGQLSAVSTDSPGAIGASLNAQTNTREDEPSASSSIESALRNAPRKEQGFFLTRQVVE